MSKNETLNAAAMAYQSGDAQAFGAIYAKLGKAARYYGARYRSPGLEIDDSAQIALEALTLAARKWAPERGAPFEAYARQCMVWAVKNAHRSAKRHAAALVWSGVDPSSHHRDAQLAPVDLAVGALDGAVRDTRDAAIIRGLVDGLDLDAIGASLGITKQAVSLRAIAIRERVGK